MRYIVQQNGCSRNGTLCTILCVYLKKWLLSRFSLANEMAGWGQPLSESGIAGSEDWRDYCSSVSIQCQHTKVRDLGKSSVWRSGEWIAE